MKHGAATADGALAEAPLILGGQKAAAYGTTDARAYPCVPAAAWCILVVELCERMSFYTLAGSQEFFLEHLGFSLGRAGGLNATMWTLCSVLTVFASWVADAVLGRYTTIVVSGVLYVLGTLIAAMGAVPGKESAVCYLTGVMGLLPIATAGIKANISNLGADQYDTRDPAQKTAQESFFSVFYCSINAGALVAFGFFTTFASSGGLGVPQAWGYSVAYGAMSLCMLVAVGIFLSGRRSYKLSPVQKRSALASLLSCLRSSAVAGGSREARSVCLGLVLLLVSIALSVAKTLMPGDGNVMMAIAFATAALGTYGIVKPCMDPSWVCSMGASPASPPEEVREVEDVRAFLAMIPRLFLGSLAFNALYNSMQFWYQQQACQMDVRLPFGSSGLQLSGSFFNIADCLAIIIATPLIVAVLEPAMKKSAQRPLSHGGKFSIGMMIAVASVMFAALLEIKRRQAPVLGISSNCAPSGVSMSDISGAWITLPYFLMGVAEMYTQPTLLHLAYSQSPPSMRTLAMAASFFIAAVSSAIFALLVVALSPYIPNDLNGGHLEYGYLVTIMVGMLLLSLFLSALRE
mmetsp:Transcript_56198/g.162888  ORF Transcript_56198/g.162888 Transcript_56198/m.162888 type:complete len:576 (+) Transcript_56198:110-1837(+)